MSDHSVENNWTPIHTKDLTGTLASRLGWKELSRELQTELFRKSIHMTVAFVPLMAAFNQVLTMVVLALGIMLYTLAESLRLQGKEIPYISRITHRASRSRDEGHFVLGPVTLGLGALACVLFYPSPAATAGILALAFGDSLSSIVGKFFGKVQIPLTGGKTWMGSAAALVSISLLLLWRGASPWQAVTIALVGTVAEALPLKDLDNLVLPLTVGLLFHFLV